MTIFDTIWRLELRLPISAVVAFSVLGLAFASCGDDADKSPTPTATATAASSSAGGLPANLTTITISDNEFTPVGLQVPVGANVTWQWTGNNPHSVVGKFDDEEITSPRLESDGVFRFAFQHAGIFEYHCGVHGEAMSGKVTIQ
jgi:plastocyanin